MCSVCVCAWYVVDCVSELGQQRADAEQAETAEAVTL